MNNQIEIIEEAFTRIENINSDSDKVILDAINNVIQEIDNGNLRLAEQINDNWIVNEYAKKAILLYFRIKKMKLISCCPDNSNWWDKIDPKFNSWDEKTFDEAGFRAVPGSIVRYGAFVGKGCVLMPSFINIGAYVDKATMVDTWATIGSCAQIGKNCHISGGAGIGGVLEPVQAGPVIIEDNCFIGARSEVAEGVVIETGAVLSMGVFIGASTKVVDRNTGEIYIGRVPSYSVVVPGSLQGKPLTDGSQGPSLYCAVIVKKVDAQTRSKTSVNELLRD